MNYRLVFLFAFFHFLCLSQVKNNTLKNANYFKKIPLETYWKLDHSIKNKTFKIEHYKPIYVIATNYLDGINKTPQSENPLNTVVKPIDFVGYELKFQLSFKSLIFSNIFSSGIGFWGAYTQSSRWQIFNEEISRPFRETNYEPEGIFVTPVNIKIFGLDLVYASVAFNHQSNGRSNPYSRSWNRLIFETGFKGKNFTLLLRPWIRISEDFKDDNNPAITDYVGRGEFIFEYINKSISIRAQARHTLTFNTNNRGSIRLNIGYKLKDALALQAQVFHGYGESLLDYNYKQTMIGLGVSFL
ncbi:MAG: phospholipase A [Winogradskyella sp.]